VVTKGFKSVGKGEKKVTKWLKPGKSWFNYVGQDGAASRRSYLSSAATTRRGSHPG
jgi:hypothetical protein